MAGEKTLNLTIRIAGQMDKSLSGVISSTQGKISTLSSQLSNIGTAGLAAIGTLATGTAAAIANCTDAAAQFTNQMSDVVKYVGGLADETGRVSDTVWTENGEAVNGKTYSQNYDEMSKAILDLSTQIPLTPEELTRLAAAAGQGGKSSTDLIQYDSSGNINGFLKDAAMMSAAMDISADQAGDWAAKWEQAFKIDHEQVMKLADQINYLGAHNPTTAAEIAQVVNDSAGLGQVAGAKDVGTTAALATAMLATGVEEARAATSITRIYSNMSLGESATDAQKEMWESLGYTAEGVASSMQQDSTGTMLGVFKSIRGLDADKQVAALKTLFGQWAIHGAANITKNIELYENALNAVNDPSKYNGSMEREFVIKSETPEALDTRMSNTMTAYKIEMGKQFLPAKKEISLSIIDFLNQLRGMPELSQVAGTLAEMFSSGIQKAGTALQSSLPYIRKALEYLAENGDKVVKVLGGLTTAFVGMKSAPLVENIISGAGSLLFGAGTGGGSPGGTSGAAGKSANRTGGVVGAVKSIFTGGQKAATGTSTVIQNIHAAASGSTGGIRERIASGAAGAVLTLQGMSGILSNNAGTAAAARNSVNARIRGINNRGAGNTIRNVLGNTKAGQAAGHVAGNVKNYFSGVGSALGNLGQTRVSSAIRNPGQTKVGSAVTRGVTRAGRATKKFLVGIAQATRLPDAAHVITNTVKSGAGKIAGGAGKIAGKIAGGAGKLVSNVAGSKPVQVIGGLAHRAAPRAGRIMSGAGEFAGAGMGVLGNIWGLMASGFGSLAAGALPVVGAITGIIAVVSILGDHLEDIRGIVENVFGESGVQVFDAFTGKLSEIGSFISGLFQDGGVANALAPVKDAITNMFGSDAGAAFDGLTQILQTVMGIVGQLVSFANTTVKPIIEEIFNFITGTVIPGILQTFTTAAPYISGILSNLGGAIMTIAQIIGSAIQAALPHIESLISMIGKIAAVVIPAVLEAFGMFAEGVKAVINSIKGIFDGLITFITGVFTLNWRKAWEGVKNIFGSIFSGLKALVKAPVNAVISLINKAISGINSLSVEIPSWVPGGGRKLGFNIPQIPMLAKGGFTNGPSIAGEAGKEAVISFKSSARERNINIWTKAGRMLGFETSPVEISEIPSYSTEESYVEYEGGKFVFSPTVIIQGNADKEVIDQALKDVEARFEKWHKKMTRTQRRTAWV